jgi:DNA excision repair protein ERCC-3
MSVLLEVDNPSYQSARDELGRFAELQKSPEYIHTYRITPLSLWNAAAAGLKAEAILQSLQRYSRYPLPDNVRADIADYVSRYGRVSLIREGDNLCLVSDDVTLMTELGRHPRLRPYILKQASALRFYVQAERRGHIKQALVAIGYPAEDLAGYAEGAPLHFRLRSITRSGNPFALRSYQQEASAAFFAGGGPRGGSGIVVLPCGAGKTAVGIAAMEQLQTSCLVLTSSTIASRQWIAELLDNTSLPAGAIGEYSGARKQIRPVTVATYQIITYRPRLRGKGGQRRTGEPAYPHFALFNDHNWGLIIYDEVHLLPAPVFRITAEIQGRRRLGLTATLVREDGREMDVFSLIGPKKYDAPWKLLERQGWIATAECHEVRMSLPDDLRLSYAMTDDREKYRVAAENPSKLDVLQQLLDIHAEESILIIGMYLSQLQRVAERYGYPLITGKTTVGERQQLYEAFRDGRIRCLIVSKVGNFAVDLPDANVAIQISGSFGSRQEEAQRLGRILRPKRDGLLAHFYSLVTRDSRDQEYAAKRQLFLTEQGYRYDILYEDELTERRSAVLARGSQAT